MRKRQTWPFSANLAILAILIVSPSATMASTTEDVGDVLALLVPLTGIATATLKHDREGQVQFLKSFATNAVITGGLKAAVDKTRPDGECCDSFPSAHSSLSFMGAAFLSRRYGPKFGIPAYAAASYVAYSRVVTDRHFVEDVVAGAAIGYLSSYFFTTEYMGVSVTPVASSDFVGISFSKTW